MKAATLLPFKFACREPKKAVTDVALAVQHKEFQVQEQVYQCAGKLAEKLNSP